MAAGINCPVDDLRHTDTLVCIMLAGRELGKILNDRSGRYSAEASQEERNYDAVRVLLNAVGYHDNLHPELERFQDTYGTAAFLRVIADALTEVATR